MSKTYSNIILQIVFAVKSREPRIDKKWQSELHAYISAVINKRNHRCLLVNSMSDHIHILLYMNPHQSVSDLVREIKTSSSHHINNQLLTKTVIRKRFHWQDGYGVFSYHESQKHMIYHYVLNQETHHAKTTFGQESRLLLMEHEINADPQYAGEWIHDEPLSGFR